MTYASWGRWIVLTCGISACGLAACGQTGAGCSSSDAQSVISDLIRDSIEKQTYAIVGEAEDGANVSRSSVRAAVAQLKLLIEDVRTSREDPNSTKRFCESTLRIRIPSETLNRAEDARSTAEVGTLTDLAEMSDIERNADSFSAPIEYNVQPTDEGDKVFGETDVGIPIVHLASETLAWSLLHSAVKRNAIASEQALQAQAAAAAEQRSADLELAKSENQLAGQAVLAAWRSLASGTRARLLPSQRAWARKKDADCSVEAASTSSDATESEAARLNCDTRETRYRIAWLQQVLSSEPQSLEVTETELDHDL